MKKYKSILGEYVAHLVVGAAMFTALLVFGGMVNLAVHWAGPIINDAAFIDLMTMVEKVILYSDVVLLLWWTLFSTFKAIKEIMDHD